MMPQLNSDAQPSIDAPTKYCLRGLVLHSMILKVSCRSRYRVVSNTGNWEKRFRSTPLFMMAWNMKRFYLPTLIQESQRITGNSLMCWELYHDSWLNNIYCGQDTEICHGVHCTQHQHIDAADRIHRDVINRDTEIATKHVIIRHWKMIFVDAVWKSTHTIERVFRIFLFPYALHAEVLLIFLFG
jgi:hypothetical protein